ncbi:MAG: hypothetical protein KIS30_05385 [Thermoplasmata archaeon]|nr:hypothetical protein [Candidatus Sysuiplasma acidicola]MBX8646175.1 hypothetical protein [Candidatus Sysuiplasma acidicola]
MGKNGKVAGELEFVASMEDELGKYVDQWIAVVGNRIVAEGNSAKEVFDRAKKVSPREVPFIMKVPRDKIMVL